ncbi:MAG: hypothetical protein NZ578_01360 [Candidatus Binatia bacterium]|nr:hypothetical protein [Candidatus Binatia bacterium]
MWERLRQEFRHAFALTPADPALTPADMALLDRLARLVVTRGMADPALLFLESVVPLNFLGSQVLYGLVPLLEVAVSPGEVQRLARILERRESIDLLIRLIHRHLATSA